MSVRPSIMGAAFPYPQGKSPMDILTQKAVAMLQREDPRWVIVHPFALNCEGSDAGSLGAVRFSARNIGVWGIWYDEPGQEKYYCEFPTLIEVRNFAARFAGHATSKVHWQEMMEFRVR